MSAAANSIEALFADVQSEMIAVSLEYVGDAASDVYVYASLENGTLFFDPFFVIRGRLVERHKVPGVDTSFPRQDALLEYGTTQLRILYTGCTELGVLIPTQLKLHYSVAARSLQSDFEYEPQYSHDPVLFNVDLSDRWQSEISAQLGPPRGF